MAFKYDRLWKLLNVRKMSKDELRTKIGASQTTIVNMGRDKNVSLDVIDRICDVLKCSPNDIMEHVPDPNSETSIIEPKYGEIYYVRNLENGGANPYLIVQNDVTNKFSNMTIGLPLTSQINKDIIPSMVSFSIKTNSLLSKDCIVQCHLVCSIEKFRLVEKLCVISDSDKSKVKNALKVVFNL